MIALLLVGCTNTVRFPPDLWNWDTGPWDTGSDTDTDTDTPPPTGEPATIQDASLVLGCNGAGTAMSAELRTIGWAGGAVVDLVGPDRIEVHPMLLMDADPGGAWDAYQVGPLPVGAAPDEQRESVDTAFTCAATLTWVVWTRDRLDAPADCVVVGPDPGAAIARVAELPGHAGLECRPLVP